MAFRKERMRLNIPGYDFECPPVVLPLDLRHSRCFVHRILKVFYRIDDIPAFETDNRRLPLRLWDMVLASTILMTAGVWMEFCASYGSPIEYITLGAASPLPANTHIAQTPTFSPSTIERSAKRHQKLRRRLGQERCTCRRI